MVSFKLLGLLKLYDRKLTRKSYITSRASDTSRLSDINDSSRHPQENTCINLVYKGSGVKVLTQTLTIVSLY